MYRALIIIIIIVVSTLWTVDVIWSRVSSLKPWWDLTPGILRARFSERGAILDSIRVTGEMREDQRRNSFLLYDFFFLFRDLFKVVFCVLCFHLYNIFGGFAVDMITSLSLPSLPPETSRYRRMRKYRHPFWTGGKNYWINMTWNFIYKKKKNEGNTFFTGKRK